MENPWHYPPLSSDRSIRILRLEGGSGNDDLVCSLWEFSLDDPNIPAYEALSYVWGNPSPAEKINFNSVPGKTITPNLAAALRGLRLPDLALILWVDALCINQDDIDERGQQVSLIGDVYAGAYHTIIWLGEDHEDTRYGIEILEMASTQFDHDQNAKAIGGDEETYVRETETFDSERNAARGFPGLGDPKWKAVVDIFSRPWFRRVWVIQELGLSRQPTFFLGRQKINFVKFMQGLVWLFTHGYLKIIPATLMAQAVQIFRCRPFKESRIPLLELLECARTFEATDPRDKVFGLLGLSHEGSELPLCRLLAPNYNKTTAEVLSNVTQHFLECRHSLGQDGNLDVFSSVVHLDRYQPTPDYPSWLPRWDRSTTYSDLSLQDHHASGAHSSQFATPFSSQEIAPKGFKVGTVVCVPKMGFEHSPLVSEDHAQWLSVKKLWMEYVTKLRSGYANDTELALAFAQTLTVGGSKEQIPGRPNAADFVAYTCERLKEEAESTSRPSQPPEDHDELSGSVTSELAPSPDIQLPLLCHGKAVEGEADRIRFGITKHTFFILDEQRIAAGPRSVCQGDVVCILYGGKVPFVLRPQRGFYTLVGECFVFGLMNGEALEEKKRQGIEDEWFRLR
ncbi:hypothetical protein BP6252_00016 [Coleophoma cylindrospora]|uniref:Heterokaryon incompatibility domain-containing protein n=1 Tax=Coleophoma cylindrospora TaxID=1849047 RepID=A0A3D8SP73_9HELO|nr:hypothetical protein BP6252_00016 [Coleophoma cylindrospora]